jgi:hypothetical protein
MARNRKFTEQIEAVYSDAVENIRFAKGQQWRVVYFAALIYAASFFIASKEHILPLADWRCWLSVAVILTCLFSIGMLADLQFRGLAKNRCRINWVYKNCFTEAQRDELSLQPRSAWSDWQIPAMLAVASIFGALVALIRIYHA